MFITSLLQSNSEENADTGFYISGIGLATLVIVHTWANRNNVRNIIEEAESEIFAPSVERGNPEEEEKLLNHWNRNSTRQAMVMVTCSMLSMVTQVIYTIIIRFSNSDPHNWKLGWAEISAFVDITRSPHFEIMWLYQNFTYLNMIITGSFSVVMISNCINFVTIQFKILQNFIRIIPDLSIKNARENNEENISIYLHKYLKDAITLHLRISELTYYFINTFSVSINALMSCSMGLMCFSVYRASMQPVRSLHTLNILSEAISASVPAWLLCINAEKMSQESKKVGDAVYEMDFVGLDVKFQKKMILLIRRSQNVVAIKVGNVLNVSHELLVQVALLIVTTMSCITIQVGYTLTKRLNNSDPRNWRLGWAEKSAFVDITRSPNFELMWLYNNFTYFYMCINGSFSVAVVGNCINFVTVQLKILQNFLKRIPEVSAKKARENNDDNISQYLHECLKDGVLFHLTISELTHYIIDTFSASINISMSFTLGLMCFSAYRASMQPLNSIHMLSILMEATSSTLPALIHCVNGEKLIKESTKVGDAVYEMDFVGSDIKFQKKMIVLIRRSQNVISVKAGNVVDVSLELLVRVNILISYVYR
ncbi:hypothetical protein FQR65_LT03844 [Abscondita terminalis]|nr:hypothetical protein FQR65_LT03844 [Abscondita terminalis]